MQPQPCSRIDLAELKAQIVKRIGAEKSKRYFTLLNMLLSQKLSKKEFDNRCFNNLLGCENVALHNQFVRSILKNACQAKTPPPVHLPAGPPKLGLQPQNSSQGREAGAVWSNGVLPSSPKKGRSGIRERKLKDRPSPLGPNGKVDHFPSSMGSEDNNMENGDATPCDYQRPVQNHLQPVAEMPEIEREEEEVGRENPPLSFSRSPLLAPLGIPFCSASVGGSRKAVVPAVAGGEVAGYYDSGVLSDTESLRKRMEQIAAAQGLGGVSVECANTMNTMLDLYLKRLIRSCVDLAGARNDPRKQQHAQKQIQNQIQGGKVVNGMWPSNHMHMNMNMNMHGGNSSSEPGQNSISLLDFKAAMELNPQQLGDDWPLLLEKISMHSFEE